MRAGDFLRIPQSNRMQGWDFAHPVPRPADTPQKTILAAICKLNGSPGPSPGAPLKSPMVSLTNPVEPTDAAPLARFFRLNKLYISARSCSRSLSVIGKFLKTDRSTSAKLGP